MCFIGRVWQYGFDVMLFFFFFFWRIFFSPKSVYILLGQIVSDDYLLVWGWSLGVVIWRFWGLACRLVVWFGYSQGMGMAKLLLLWWVKFGLQWRWSRLVGSWSLRVTTTSVIDMIRMVKIIVRKYYLNKIERKYIELDGKSI